MLGSFVIGWLAAAALLVAWYCWFRRANRLRAVRILSWIEHAFSGHASVSRARWHGASRFRVDLRLGASIFRNASLAVELEPRELPINWLYSRARKRKEMVKFEAELEHRPRRNLHIQKHQWSARTRRIKLPSLHEWRIVSLRPMLISTQPNWKNKSGNMLETLQMLARACELYEVDFRKQEPHFVVTAPLQSLCPELPDAGMFKMLHELASIASTSAH
jgi:hypothetical protein